MSFWGLRYRYSKLDFPEQSPLGQLEKLLHLVGMTGEDRKAGREVIGLLQGRVCEDKDSIERNILCHFLPEIESCRDNIDPEDRTSKHISLLIGHMKSSHADIKQRLDALLEVKEITYDLLWALFKPNTLVYTTCQGTKKPRCIRYEAAEEETTPSRVEYFHIKGSYLDFDGKIVEKVSIETAILKFHGSKLNNLLEVFPLHYHKEVKAVPSLE